MYDVKLLKQITKTDEVITTKNILIVGGVTRTVNFDFIDGYYRDRINIDNVVICPGGKFHPYDVINGQHINAPSGFEDSGNWDLRCFNHQTNFFLMLYLMNKYHNFFYHYFRAMEIYRKLQYFLLIYMIIS